MSDLITCKVCGKQSNRIYGAHLKSHGLTSNDYKRMYPGEPLYSESDNKNTKINSGKHMKTDKYKKMFSKMFSGENNPNSKSRTTEEQRRQRSPFSKDFIKYDNDNQALAFSRKVSNAIGPEKRPIKIEYWLNKGYSEEDAKLKLTERQQTFTLEKCIKKYGEIKGKERWMNRQIKWMNSYKKNNFSMISQKLFWSIYEKLENKEEIYFATLKNGVTDFTGGNNEFRLKLNNMVLLPDFFMKNEYKIIEFDGTYYHRDSPENKKRSLLRDKELYNDGFKVHHVSESDYRSNPSKVLSECLEFLIK